MSQLITSGGRRYFRTLGGSVFPALGLALVSVVLASGAVQAAAVVARVVLGCLAVAGVWLTVRVARSGVVTTEHGVEVRGWIRSRRAGWSQVERFTTMPTGARNSSVYVAVRLSDGTQLKTVGLTASRAGSDAPPMLAELEALRNAAASRHDSAA